MVDRLMADGAIIKLFVGSSLPHLETLAALDRPTVYPIEVAALIDTGASTTCIDKKVRLRDTPYRTHVGSIPEWLAFPSVRR